MDTKRCSGCKRTLPTNTDYFYARTDSSLMACCKECHRQAVSARQTPKTLYCELGHHYWQSKGKGGAASACPQHYDRNALRRLRRQQDPEKYRTEERRRFDRLSGDQKRQQWRKLHDWGQEHPGRMREAHRRVEGNRRGAKRNRFLEDVDPQTVYQMHGGRCGICGGFIDLDQTDFHVDHVIPLSKGGWHGYVNVQPAHPVCNWRKGNREG